MSYNREFFRLRLSVPFSFTVLEAKNPSIARNRRFADQTKDLSGGGLSFETDLPLVQGDVLHLHLTLPVSEAGPSPAGPVEVKSQVVWSRKEDDGTYHGGLVFVDIDAEEQDRIIGFIFRAQIEARKVGDSEDAADSSL